MPAVGLGLLLFLLAQALVAVAATREARLFGARLPRVVGGVVFVLGVGAAFALGGVLEVLVVEVLVLLLVSALRRRSRPAP